MLKDLVLKNRSYRRFYEEVPVGLETLRGLVDLARTTPSASNQQPLKYILSADREVNAAIYGTLGWARFLQDWPGPSEGERPAAYIVLLGDTAVGRSWTSDVGIAMQTILLGATEQGLGGCILGSINREALRQALDIPASYEILNVVALGKPKETVILDSLGPDGNTRYWRDSLGVHHVPKRTLDDLIIAERG